MASRRGVRFDDASANDRHLTQYFEMLGNRAIYMAGWHRSQNASGGKRRARRLRVHTRRQFLMGSDSRTSKGG
jgi:arylsulfatase A-like enzyme